MKHVAVPAGALAYSACRGSAQPVSDGSLAKGKGQPARARCGLELTIATGLWGVDRAERFAVFVERFGVYTFFTS